MRPLIINLNNTVIVKGAGDCWLWGLVHDINATGLLINFDIPHQKPEWVPFDRVRLPPTTNYLSGNNYSGDERRPKECYFVAVRRDETGPFIWQSAISYRKIYAHTVVVKFLHNGKEKLESIPPMRAFRCSFPAELSLDSVLINGRLVTAHTFHTENMSGPNLGLKIRELMVDPGFNCYLNNVHNDIACLIIGTDSVTAVNIQNDGTPRPCKKWKRAVMDIDDFGAWDLPAPVRWNEVAGNIDDGGNADMLTTKFALCSESFPANNATINKVVCLEILLEIFGQVDTVTQTRLRAVCSKWNIILCHESILQHAYLCNYYHLNCTDSGFLSFSTPGSVWYAGVKSAEYRVRRALNRLPRTAHTLRLADMSTYAIGGLLFPSPFHSKDRIPVRWLILDRPDAVVSELGPSLTGSKNTRRITLQLLLFMSEFVIIKNSSGECYRFHKSGGFPGEMVGAVSQVPVVPVFFP
ncbi:uncharacterized protein LOC129598091 isoform X2 [Paramacrobiotus metropolitanus]|uniref:uncharacterized protein LOC129598091 isoform X2 n=1 Tax=Paramacrobiotus metropolitanus TaxID=2943436 RepID=UPI002445C0B0|nr:uncharacterized protein LOC129598091 isoform X2 [Paramacrobiotus metropolitanus]